MKKISFVLVAVAAIALSACCGKCCKNGENNECCCDSAKVCCCDSAKACCCDSAKACCEIAPCCTEAVAESIEEAAE